MSSGYSTTSSTTGSIRQRSKWYRTKVCAVAIIVASTTTIYFYLDAISTTTTTTSSSAASKNKKIYKGHQYTIDGKTVTVGTQGPSVTLARTKRLPQRNKGWPKETWDIIEQTNCLTRQPPHGGSQFSNRTMTTNSLESMTTTHDMSSPLAPKELIRSNFLPEALLIGVQKGGTTALSNYLHQHPEVTRMKKELYFLDESVDRMLIYRSYNFIPHPENMNTIAEPSAQYTGQEQPRPKQQNGTHEQGRMGIPQRKIQEMYGAMIRQEIHDDDDHNQNDKIVLDMTPNYIFQSDRIPQRISCILPWAKVIVLLRNPIERARSQYDMKLRFLDINKPRAVPSFASYIRTDIDALRETGVLQDWSTVDFDTFFNSNAMKEAWRTYLNSGLNAPVGMGLYALQILPLLQEIPRDKLLIIKSENLQAATDKTYGQVLDFLGLRPFQLNAYNDANKGKGTNIDAKTTELLKNVFDPFNRKLGELLGDEWEGIWQ